MNIAIIGPGNVGGALAQRWADHGHLVVLGIRDKPVNDSVQALAQHPNIRTAPLLEAVHSAEVVLYAAPAHVALTVIGSLGKLTDQVLIDASNALGKYPEPYATAFHAFADKTQAQVAKAFNTIGYETMADPDFQGTAADLFVAGNHTEAKAIATQLARDAGFEEVYDFGGNDRVELLEQLAQSWINLALKQGYGREIAFKILKR